MTATKQRMMATCTEADFREHMNSYDGFCLACGEWTEGGTEPDAEGYECVACGASRVVGAEQLLFYGRVRFTDSEATP